jgi:hypothetical protein
LRIALVVWGGVSELRTGYERSGADTPRSIATDAVSALNVEPGG